MIVYTSGTESTAKGCVHTWNTVDFSARGLARDVFRLTPDDVVFMPSPVAHATGLVVGILAPLTAGAQTHLLDTWEPNEGLRRIEERRCTVTATATPFVRMALDARTEQRTRSHVHEVLALRRRAPIPARTRTSRRWRSWPTPDERLGEKVCAVVVPRPDRTVSLDGLATFLADRQIAMQKLPERLPIVDALPMTATGKVQKFLLRQLAREAG